MDNIDIRIEETIESMAEAGMPMNAQDISDLTRVLKGEISFEDLIQPKIDKMIKQCPDYIDALHDDITESDAELDRRFRQGLAIILAEKKRLGFPVAKYDRKQKIAYLEYPWGLREYVSKNMNDDRHLL